MFIIDCVVSVICIDNSYIYIYIYIYIYSTVAEGWWVLITCPMLIQIMLIHLFKIYLIILLKYMIKC